MWGTEVVQVLKFVEIDFAGTLAARNSTDREASPSSAVVKRAEEGCRGISVTPLDSKVVSALK